MAPSGYVEITPAQTSCLWRLEKGSSVSLHLHFAPHDAWSNRFRQVWSAAAGGGQRFHIGPLGFAIRYRWSNLQGQ